MTITVLAEYVLIPSPVGPPLLALVLGLGERTGKLVVRSGNDILTINPARAIPVSGYQKTKNRTPIGFGQFKY